MLFVDHYFSLWRANYTPIDLDKQESKLWKQYRCQGHIVSIQVLTLLWRLFPFITDSRSLESLEIPFWWDSSNAGGYSGLQDDRRLMMEFSWFLLQEGSFCNFCLMAWCAQLIKTMGKMNWNVRIYIWIQNNLILIVMTYLHDKNKTCVHQTPFLVFPPLFHTIGNRIILNHFHYCIRHRNYIQISAQK